MVWECGDCSQQESRQLAVDAVCHHCGKLLCRDDQYRLQDPSFRGQFGSRERIAVHCRDCRDAFHPTPVGNGRRTT